MIVFFHAILLIKLDIVLKSKPNRTTNIIQIPMKNLDILYNESDDIFSEQGTQTIEKSEKLFFRLDRSFSSVEKFSHVRRS